MRWPWPGRRPEGRSVPGWDMAGRPWREAEFCVLDLETTGLDLRRDEIVSWGAVVVRGGRAAAGSASTGLVRPQLPPPAGAIAVHGIRPQDLDGAPGPTEAADSILEVLSGRALVAHAAWVETAFLTRLLRLRGVRLDGPVVDTAALARAAGAVRAVDAAEPGLEDLAGRLGLPVHTPHQALGDALTTAVVFLALAARLEQGEPHTVSSLAALSRRHALR